MQLNEEETSLFDVLWLLLASVIFVPIVQKIPGGKSFFSKPAAEMLVLILRRVSRNCFLNMGITGGHAKF